jgi:DNA-binding phage protein
MATAKTYRYDTAEHLRTPEEMALSGERRPGFDTILRVIDALGIRLHAEAK